jgi:hypothetical protein
MSQKNEISTVKLQKETKSRMLQLKTYKRETYDEIIQKMLTILNICKANPERAQARLRAIDRQKRQKAPQSQQDKTKSQS